MIYIIIFFAAILVLVLLSKNNAKKITNDTTYQTRFSGKKILVIDDNELNLKATKNILKIYGFSIDCYMSGEELKNANIDLNQYCIIMIDDVMPHMNGVDTLNMLKMKTKDLPPTVALTTNDNLKSKFELIKNGFTDVMTKPIKNEDLDVVLFKMIK